MKDLDFAEVMELLDLFRKLPPKLQQEMFFIIKGAALVNESL